MGKKQLEKTKYYTKTKTNDGQIIISKIDSFLDKRNLPQEKKAMIINDLFRVFIYSDLWKPIKGESKLKFSGIFNFFHKTND